MKTLIEILSQGDHLKDVDDLPYLPQKAQHMKTKYIHCRIDDRTNKMLDCLAEKFGWTRTEVITDMIRLKAAKEGIELDTNKTNNL